ncbi:error-prone DNA polymerase [Dyadobacter sandarakinus]|uniref:Error-prone DNA polymerase n=1 Tax=Dyadobacter sandarakinus TaxID=2747268 RepID=A0ABX7I3U1_9BACT|nr:error-prone DNA polymerase [Dyadobacter sandarakinus]QRR00590.1 error-prone DNA polymerase [Dyadobacter sandarakinus]
MGYTELQVTTNFSFLQGASHPEELVEQALYFGYKKIAITDHNTLAGIVRAHAAAKGKDITIIPAVRLDLLDGPSLLAYPTTQPAYSRLSALLTEGNLRTEKGKCDIYKKDVYQYAGDIRFIAVPPSTLNEAFHFDPDFEKNLAEYRQVLGGDLYLGMYRSYQGDDVKKLFRLSQLSEKLDIPLVATNDVHYHEPGRRELQDILTCIREKCTIYNAGFRLYENSERYLKPMDEMERLFRHYPDALARTMEIAEACQFSLSSLKYIYPEEITTQDRSPMEMLQVLTWQGAMDHYGPCIPEVIIDNIEHEMTFIEEMDYAPYFLTVYDIVRFAREQKILCQGRGSAANSTVCYCLGITAVDPTKFSLLFERFISSARNEPPDIDVDFEHERREEVIQYIYQKYGRDRAGIVATVTQQHQRGAVRDVAKAMGMSLDAINRLAGAIWEFTDEWFDGTRVTEQGFNPGDPHLLKILDLTRQFMGFPRQLGQHTGGFVITQGKLSDLCPVLNARMKDRTCIEWNKDDIDTLGFLKIDVLALGMLTCIRKAFDLLEKHYNQSYTLATVPQDDAGVYEMISNADTIGVFQIESRAQQAMLPHLRPKEFYDLVIEVAIVRPGPIQGDMVHPYLRRRNNKEKVIYPSKELEEILSKTLGVPLFQEQAMKIAIVAAGFTPSEADELRRSMATFKAKGMVTRFQEKLTKGMMERGYTEEFSQRIFKQLEGFGSYGFPESHAASFALLVYVSAFIKCYFPDVFAAALLNSQPMGFYQPAQLVSDARKHDVVVREIDINFSQWDITLEEKAGRYCAVRLGFRQIKGLRQEDIQLLLAGRTRAYKSIAAVREAGVPEAALEKLADADAFRSIGLDRRSALWEVSALSDRPVGLFAGQPSESSREPQVSLPGMSLSEHVVHDYASISMSLKAHPVGFVREKLNEKKVITAKQLDLIGNMMPVKVAGLVLVRQRPGTAGGVCFITIEDETGFANLVIFQGLFEKYRKEILHARLLMVQGKLQRDGDVTHVIVKSCHDLSPLLRELSSVKRDPAVLTLSRADEKDEYASQAVNRKTQVREVIQGEIFHSGRNFR